MLTLNRARLVCEDAIIALCEGASPDAVRALFLRHPDAAEAVLVYFDTRYRYGLRLVAGWEMSALSLDVLALVAACGGPRVAHGFIALGLDVACDEVLGQLVRDVADPHVLARAIEVAMRGDPLARRRAGTLAYHTINTERRDMDPNRASCVP